MSKKTKPRASARRRADAAVPDKHVQALADHLEAADPKHVAEAFKEETQGPPPPPPPRPPTPEEQKEIDEAAKYASRVKAAAALHDLVQSKKPAQEQLLFLAKLLDIELFTQDEVKRLLEFAEGRPDGKSLEEHAVEAQRRIDLYRRVRPTVGLSHAWSTMAALFGGALGAYSLMRRGKK